ncbi:MAG TPA: hypothetical protein VIT92_08555, partial [Burkholderiaceae bacterium]
MKQQTTNTGQNADPRPGKLVVCVSDLNGAGAVISKAQINVYNAPANIDCDCFDPAIWRADEASYVIGSTTGDDGCITFTDLDDGYYVVTYEHFPETQPHCTHVTAGCTSDVCLKIDINAGAEILLMTSDCKPIPCPQPRNGDTVRFRFFYNFSDTMRNHVRIVAPAGMKPVPGEYGNYSTQIHSPGRHVYVGHLEFATLKPSLHGAGRHRHRHGSGHQHAHVRARVLPSAHAHGMGGGGLGGGGLGGGGNGDGDNFARLTVLGEVDANEAVAQPITGNVGVSLTRTETEPTEDLPLWTLIRNSTDALAFNNYLRFMDLLFCRTDGFSPNDPARVAFNNLSARRSLPFTDSEAYRVLKVATEAFLMLNCGVLDIPQAFNQSQDRDYLSRRDIPFSNKDLADILNQDYLETINGVPILPYLALIRRKLPDVNISAFSVLGPEADLCFGFMQEKLTNPCMVELIWSYWNEEGMLVQTMNAITRRFQNIHAPAKPDPLANLEIDPLRPLNNLIWGYTQDEQHRLTVSRRNHEYDHHYGLHLQGKAVQFFRPVDSRSPFLEAFHNLLRLCTVFFKQDDDTTVKADAFPILNALKEVHLILSQGAHNQFGDLPSTARIEMLMQQWLLARPEFREFLPTRLMVAYPEPWMDRVDA